MGEIRLSETKSTPALARRVRSPFAGEAATDPGRLGGMMELLVLDRWDVADRGVQAGMVIPADPFHDRELVRRRYLSVDPDNRLVADTLEADWDDKLRQLQAAQDDYEHATAAALSDEHKPGSAGSPPTSPSSGQTRAPRNANANASPGS